MSEYLVEEKCTLKDFTDSHSPQASFCFSLLLREREIKVNGVRVTKNIELTKGDKVSYYLSQKRQALKSHEVVFEDENIIICDKYSGVMSEGLFFELAQKGEYYPLHRLDRNTMGLIALAKNKVAEKVLLKAFKGDGVKKEYLAVALAHFGEEHRVLTAYLKKDAESAMVEVFDREVENSKKIITEYTVLEKMGECALVSVTLHTGKTHQIRAHLAHIGCPVLGDTKYGSEGFNKRHNATRQALVAKRLMFNVPEPLAYLNDMVIESQFTPLRLI